MSKITVLQSSARADAKSARVATALGAQLKDMDLDHQLVSVADFLTTPATCRLSDHPDDAGLLRWQQTVSDTTALVMVVPEYNHSVPGEWKLLIDSLSSSDYRGVPVFLVSVSAGSFGGVRVADHCLPVLHTLGLTVQSAALHVTNVGDRFNEQGTITDDATADRVQTFLTSVAAVCKV